ncbi:MAG TPA: chemotaxis protein CheW [Candidatus Binatia bacterium]|jgi:purine-binding chemotaxis protein CheW
MDDKNIIVDGGENGREDFAELLRERARILSEVPAPEESGEKISALSFVLSGELYGVELKYLAETRQATPLRRLPSAPPHLAGLMNLRGELVPVVDLGPVVGLGQREMAALLPAILVLSLQGNKLALAVDQAQDILTFPAKELQPPPLSLEPERALFIRGVYLTERRLLSLLDVEKIVADPRFAGPGREGSEQF